MVAVSSVFYIVMLIVYSNSGDALHKNLQLLIH